MPDTPKPPPAPKPLDANAVSGQMLELVLAANQVGTWQREYATGAVSWDANLFALFGESPRPGAERQVWAERVLAEDRERVERDVAALEARGAGEIEARFRVRHADGSERVLAGRTRLLCTPDGAPAFIFGVNWDTTEQEAVRSALDDHRERLAVALDAARMGSFRWDLKTGAVDFDERLMRLYGAEPSADPTAAYEAAIDPADTERVQADTEAAIASGTLQTRFRIVRPGGEESWLESRGRITFDDDGQPAYMTGVNFDVREAVERERALADAREQALAASRAKSAFLAAMSHEIRTPLNGVIGLADALIRRELGPDEQSLVTALRASGRSLRALIDDVLDLSRIESDALTLSPAPTSLSGLLREVTSVLQPTADVRHLALRLSTAPGLQDWWALDAGRLRQVLLNIVGNALKFTDVGEVHLSAAAEPSGLVFEVIDSGIGIAEADRERVFEPFVQADSSASRRHGGTGLGLAISRRLVRQMGGDVTVHGRPEGGTRFVVRLPAEPSAAPQGSAATSDDLPPHLRVLVVEDNPINQLVVREQLAALGLADVACVGDGLQAVRACDAERWDVVLMDCQMPVMDGYEATLRLRNTGRCTDAAVVALTAHAMVQDRERCLACGMDAYVSKPVELDVLAGAIREALAARQG